MKKNLFLILTSAFLLFSLGACDGGDKTSSSCNCSSSEAETSSSGGGTTSSTSSQDNATYSYYVTLGTQDIGVSEDVGADLLADQTGQYRASLGNVVAGTSITIKNSDKVALSDQFGKEPGNNNVSGELGSFTIHNDAENAFLLIKTWSSGWTNFYVSGYEAGINEAAGHGPEGSTLVDWYIAGQGSLWEDSWNVESGVQLYSNPAGATDKGCILEITFQENDKFKITDGSTWYGYEKVKQEDSPNNKGKTNFAADDDGYGGKNIKCTVAGSYNIYVNSEGIFWIESA